MINDQTKELIHAGVDGELDDAGEDGLRKVLEKSEEARHYHSELSRLADFLDKIPDHELPDGLHARITDQVQLPSRSSFKSIFSFSELPSFLRYGFAAAAGLVLAVAIYENRAALQDPNDFSNMVGTMTRGGPGDLQKVLDSQSFDQAGVSGEIHLERRNGALVLEIQLESAQPLDFTVDFSDNGLEFNAFAQMESGLDSITYADGVLRGTSSGQQRLVVLLHPGKADQAGASRAGVGPGIGLEFTQQGAVVHSGQLQLGG